MAFVPLNTNNSNLSNYNNVNNAIRDLNNKKIKNANLSTTPGEPGGVWIAYTPTISGATGTAYGRYLTIGKTVFLTVRMEYTGAQTGNIQVPLPTGHTAANQIVSYVGSAWAIDTLVTHRTGTSRITANDNKINIYKDNFGGQWNATEPFTWGNTDKFEISIVYEKQ